MYHYEIEVEDGEGNAHTAKASAETLVEAVNEVRRQIGGKWVCKSMRIVKAD